MLPGQLDIQNSAADFQEEGALRTREAGPSRGLSAGLNVGCPEIQQQCE
jgi:hypothetical protein